MTEMNTVQKDPNEAPVASDNRTMLDFYVKARGVVNGKERDVYVLLDGVEGRLAAYTVADFHKEIKTGKFDLIGISEELGINDVTIKAVRELDERTPRVITEIKL